MKKCSIQCPFLKVCGSQNTVLPTLASSPYSALSANSAQTCTSLPNPPDEVFLDRLAERFSQHPHIDVGGRPSSSATTTTTTSGVDDDDNVDDRRGANDDDDDKACADDKHLPQHCFRFASSLNLLGWSRTHDIRTQKLPRSFFCYLLSPEKLQRPFHLGPVL